MNALKTWYEGAKMRFESLPFRTLRMVVMHPGSGPIIEKDAHTPHDPASLTKLMNFYVACSMATSAPANIPISAHSVSVSKNNADILKAGGTLPWDTALSAMMVASDNRAATAIAEALGSGPTSEARHREYVARMNSTARELGMHHSYFINASGMVVKPAPKKLPHTTATDMATLMTAIYRDFPEEAKRHLEASEVTYANHRFNAHHGLNTPQAPSFIGTFSDYILNSGSKTGFTNRALYNIATMVRGTENQSLVIVLMGVSPTTMTNALGLVEKDSVPLRTRKTKDPKSVDGDALRDALAQKVIHLWAKAAKEAEKIYIPTLAPAPEPMPPLPRPHLTISPLPFDDVLISDFVPLPTALPASVAAAASEPAR
jgi:D-alanyl-D-alanine carboxypeptidase